MFFSEPIHREPIQFPEPIKFTPTPPTVWVTTTTPTVNRDWAEAMADEMAEFGVGLVNHFKNNAKATFTNLEVADKIESELTQKMKQLNGKISDAGK